MLIVEQLIGELLLRHNCVIVPSFGGFVAKKLSASIDFASGTMLPPRKSLLFNRQLINNDGLLVAEIAVRNKIGYEEAVDQLRLVVNNWEKSLSNGERITIDKVGFLFYDKEKNICFEQDRFFNLLLESYGLGKVHFLSEEDVHIAQKSVVQQKSLHDEGGVSAILYNKESVEHSFKQESSVKENGIIIPHPELKRNSKAWKYIAAACILPIAFYTIWIPTKTDFLKSGVLSINHFNPFYSSPIAQSPKSPAPAVNNQKIELKDAANNMLSDSKNSPNEELNIAVPEPENSSNVPSLPLTSKNKKPIKNTKKEFDYIVGSFGDVNNAEKKIKELKSLGFEAFITETSNGMNRVSIGKCYSSYEIKNLANEAEKAGLKGWVLKK